MVSTPEPRIIVALDVTVKVISFAAIIEGRPLPRCVAITSPDAGTSHSVASTLHRHRSTISRVMEVATKRGVPTLALMVKPQWGLQKDDPSAARRLWLWGLVAGALSDICPVAEVPTLTLAAFMRTPGAMGRRGADALAARVTELYPRLENPGNGFRMSTVAAALAGATVAGVDTEVAVDSDRLKALQPNTALQWPANLKPPATLGEWARRNSREDTDSPATLAG